MKLCSLTEVDTIVRRSLSRNSPTAVQSQHLAPLPLLSLLTPRRPPHRARLRPSHGHRLNLAPPDVVTNRFHDTKGALDIITESSECDVDGASGFCCTVRPTTSEPSKATTLVNARSATIVVLPGGGQTGCEVVEDAQDVVYVASRTPPNRLLVHTARTSAGTHDAEVVG